MATALTLTSPSFSHNGFIPEKFTCDGENVSPALQWSNVPAGTKDLVLIVDDPDAPRATPWVHWIVFNIDPKLTGFQEHMDIKAFKTGKNDSVDQREGIWHYSGPCPPSGTHRYFFKLYALDALLNLPVGAHKQDVLAAMKNHVVGTAELVGLYAHKS